ncbi:MAG: ATP-binding protein [Chloroflexota bacterium]
MRIERILQSQLEQTLLPGKVVLLYGPRQVGKTTLARSLMDIVQRQTRFINADELIYRDALASQNRQKLDEVLGDADLLIIDEAQRVTDIGINLKILIDNHPTITILATGSASFELANKIHEPLTGRKITFNLYPVSYREISNSFGALEARESLERWLIWGVYPEIVTCPSHLRERLLGELVGSYLYLDLLELEGLRRADKLVDLLRLLAYQIGHEVSLNELATNLGMNRQTVERYLDLLEKVFVIYRVGGFSRNLRKEISKNARYYFYDNGVRNSLIQNFNPLALRNDIGQLWENFLMIERRKAHEYASRSVNTYFWRTYDQKEIDLVEERQGKLLGFEFKWKSGSIKKSTEKEFLSAYPNAELFTISQDNFTEFLNSDNRNNGGIQSFGATSQA